MASLGQVFAEIDASQLQQDEQAKKKILDTVGGVINNLATQKANSEYYNTLVKLSGLDPSIYKYNANLPMQANEQIINFGKERKDLESMAKNLNIQAAPEMTNAVLKDQIAQAQKKRDLETQLSANLEQHKQIVTFDKAQEQKDILSYVNYLNKEYGANINPDSNGNYPTGKFLEYIAESSDKKKKDEATAQSIKNLYGIDIPKIAGGYPSAEIQMGFVRTKLEAENSRLVRQNQMAIAQLQTNLQQNKIDAKDANKAKDEINSAYVKQMAAYGKYKAAADDPDSYKVEDIAKLRAVYLSEREKYLAVRSQYGIIDTNNAPQSTSNVDQYLMQGFGEQQ